MVLNNENREFIDLTYPLSPESQVWPGEGKPEFESVSSLPEDPANVSRISLNLHSETHVDSPRHFIEGGASIDEVPIETFYGKAAVYHHPEEPDGGEIQLEEVRNSEVELDGKDIFLLHSDLEEMRGDDRYFRDFPVPSEELLDWLLNRGISCYGTDAPSVDPFGSDSHERHHKLLSEEVPIIENLAELGRMEYGEEILFFAFPLKLKGLEASPCRAGAVKLIED
jgi:arylformamidase